jgi:hypothetical protein
MALIDQNVRERDGMIDIGRGFLVFAALVLSIIIVVKAGTITERVQTAGIRESLFLLVWSVEHPWNT